MKGFAMFPYGYQIAPQLHKYVSSKGAFIINITISSVNPFSRLSQVRIAPLFANHYCLLLVLNMFFHNLSK
jgi:hypothetical protein